jgi:hypothetical protein
MLETVVTIILIPIALGSIVFTGAIIAGVCAYIKENKKS